MRYFCNVHRRRRWGLITCQRQDFCLCNRLKNSFSQADKFYCEIKFCNYSDPLCYVENLLIIGGYKDDFNGLRDSLICA